MRGEAEISPEDALRLNVMLAQKPAAVRIDESRLIVYALTDKGEARVELRPNCEEGAYLRRIKALLSTQVLGSPGGYPVFLRRWTRMGQARDARLEQLLLLGESEAVVAVAHAPGLDASLARRAWWAMPDAANARVMLQNRRVAASEIGRELAAFLLEFLPFEEAPADMLESVRRVLQPGLIDDDAVAQLWRRAQSKRAMLVGFLHARPDALPRDVPAHPALCSHRELFDAPGNRQDPRIAILRRVFAPPGQAFLESCELALARLPDQDVTVSLFEAIADYFGAARFTERGYREIAELEAAVYDQPLTVATELADWTRSVLFLAGVSVELLNPIFARSDAIGSGMRRKIAPLTDRIVHHLRALRST